MCIQNALQQHILDITDNGKEIVEFFYATMHGQNPNAKFHHQMEAAKQLRELGLTDAEFIAGRSEPTEPPDNPTDNPELKTDNSKLSTENRPVTDFDIINYEVAGLIREETGDGYFIADFLARIMRGKDARRRPFSETDRMAAAKELMNRGMGRFGDCRSRRISNSREDLELIHSGLSRYIRERTDHGLDTARFLLDVASGQDEDFSMHQRAVATRELLRRGWDTNYDAITRDDIAAYYERQDALQPTDYDVRLQQWHENERAAQADRREHNPHEDEPQLEAGIFAHLTNAEIARYEAMSDNEQQEFVKQQRQRRANHKSAAEQPTDLPETTDEPTEDHENTNWNTLIQDASAPESTSNPTRPVRSQSLTHIRSP